MRKNLLRKRNNARRNHPESNFTMKHKYFGIYEILSGDKVIGEVKGKDNAAAYIKELM